MLANAVQVWVLPARVVAQEGLGGLQDMARGALEGALVVVFVDVLGRMTMLGHRAATGFAPNSLLGRLSGTEETDSWESAM